MSTTIESDNIIRWEDTIEFKFPVYSGKVIKVYDGDTITIASKMPYENSPLYRSVSYTHLTLPTNREV